MASDRTGLSTKVDTIARWGPLRFQYSNILIHSGLGPWHDRVRSLVPVLLARVRECQFIRSGNGFAVDWTSLMQKKILIVEDDDDSRDLLMQSLEGSYELVTAKDGCEAIEQAVRELPDLILMDLRLPNLDGWQTTLRLKADPQLKDIPVIAMTAHGLSEDETRAREAGCADYVSKPISPRSLVKLVEQWIADQPNRR